MTTLEILKAARAKIVQGWTQDEVARDSNGQCVAPDSPYAVCWCAIGAVRAVADRKTVEGQDALYLLREAIPQECSIAYYNDSFARTADEILAVYDEAIGSLEARVI